MVSVLMQTGKDDWETPQKLFEELDREFHFSLDPCSTHKNAKCKKHYTPEENGLLMDWAGETVFCNPPYSVGGGQDKWVQKCCEEAQKPGTVVVALLPARTDTERFHKYILNKAEIRFIPGRLYFEQGGIATGRATFPSMICIWRGQKATAQTGRGLVKNAVIKYPGAKWSLAQWIIGHFPPHHSYLEPFFGSGAVLFKKSRSNIETINDLDGDIVNLFRWIRDDPERLAREIYMIPYARDVYDKAFEEQYTETDSFQRAVNFYIRMMMGHGFRTTGEKVGWKNDVQGREAAYAAKYWCKTPEVVLEAAERLRGVQIENMPAVELISRFNFPNVLIYADPPYLLGTRHGKQYRHEMSDSDHRDLLDVLKAHSGPMLLSGYDNDLYNDALRTWHREERNAVAQTSTQRTEVLWMNFEPEGQISFYEEIKHETNPV